MKFPITKLSLIIIIDKLLSLLSMVFLLLLIFGFGDFTVTVITLIAAFFHELGHVFSGYIFSVRCKLSVHFNGFRLKPSALISYKKTLIVALCGPLANFTLCVILLPFLSLGSELIYTAIAINALTAISNLMPIKGYDGYKIINSLLSDSRLQRAGALVLDALSDILSILICFFSLFLMLALNTGYWSYVIFFTNMSKTVLKGKSLN